MTGEQTRTEILQQPEAWARTLDRVSPLTELNTLEPSIYLGAGITLHIARCVATLTRAAARRASYALPAQDAYAFPGAVATRSPSLYVIIARTGDVSDAVHAFEALRAAPGVRVAVIGEDGGPLAGLADRVIAAQVYEKSVATTSTLTSMLLLVQAGIWRAVGHPGGDGLRRLPDLLARLLPAFDAAAKAEAARDVDEIVVLGTGPYYGLAETGALSIREMAVAHAVAHHTLVYPHGQKVTITPQTLVVLFASDGARARERQVVSDVRAMGGRSVAVGERAGELEADVAVEIASGLDESQRLALHPPFAQLLGYHLARRKNVDPDQPPHLPKVF